jgi:hypothetical protein
MNNDNRMTIDITPWGTLRPATKALLAGYGYDLAEILLHIRTIHPVHKVENNRVVLSGGNYRSVCNEIATFLLYGPVVPEARGMLGRKGYINLYHFHALGYFVEIFTAEKGLREIIVPVGLEDHDFCGYCGAGNGIGGAYRVGYDCCYCGGN